MTGIISLDIDRCSSARAANDCDLHNVLSLYYFMRRI